MGDDITITLSASEATILSGMFGLGIAVMQNDRDTAERFGQSLSSPVVEEVAQALMVKLSQALTTPVQTWDEGDGAE
jgi:RsiW-degrading membrane proteinase PrsW (M82 family)